MSLSILLLSPILFSPFPVLSCSRKKPPCKRIKRKMQLNNCIYFRFFQSSSLPIFTRSREKSPTGPGEGVKAIFVFITIFCLSIFIFLEKEALTSGGKNTIRRQEKNQFHIFKIKFKKQLS